MYLSLPDIIGILGFLIALGTFILTRLDKRKKLTIDIYAGSIEDFNNPDLKEYHKDTEYVIIDVINTCQKPITVDKESIRIRIKNKDIDRKIDWLNIDETNSLLNPGTQIKYGVYFNELCDYVGIDNKKLKEYKIEAYLKDLSGKRYNSNNKYLLNNVGISIRKK